MYKKLATETVIYGLGAILPRLINFLLISLFTDYFSNEQFSVYAQLFAFASFINIFLSFGFETAFFRFAAKEKNFQKVFDSSFWFIAINATVFLMVFHFFLPTLSEMMDYPEHPEYLQWFAIITFLDALAVIPLAYLRYHNKPIRFSIIKIAASAFNTLLIIVGLVWFAHQKLNFGLIQINEPVAFPFVANMLSSGMALVLLFSVWRKVGFNLSKELIQQMIPYAYPIMLAGLAFAINENLDKLVMRNLISEHEAGAYGACYKLAALMTLFVTAYRMGVEPFFFKESVSKNPQKTYATVLQYFTIVAGAVALGILGNLHWIKSIFIRQESYYEAMAIVPIIVFANLFFGIYNSLSIWYKVTDRTKIGLYISWIGAGITIVLNLILLPKFGFMISAWATLFAYLSMMTISYIWGQKLYHIPYKRNKILFYLLLTLIFGSLSYYAFDSHIILGNLVLIIYLLIAFFIEKASLKIKTDAS